MRKILLFLILLGVVFPVEVEWQVSKIPDYINKPWEGYWINNYYSNEVLNCEVMHKSLDDLKLEELNEIEDREVRAKLDEAKKDYMTATQLRELCLKYNYFEGNTRLTAVENVIEHAVNYWKDALRDAEAENDTERAEKARKCVNSYLLCSSSFWFWCLFQMIDCTEYVFHGYNQSYNACLDYDIYWKATMSNSAQALEISAKKANEKYNILKEAYENLTWAGMCSPNYTWNGKDTCNGIAEELLEMQAGSSFALGGHEGLLRKINSYDKEMKSTGIINTSNYSIIVKEVWKVAIPYTENKTRECSVAMKNALDEYEMAKVKTENKQADAEVWVEKCTSEKLTDLNFAWIGGKFEIGGTAGIENDCETAEKAYKAAKDACKLSEAAYNGGAEDWLLRAFEYEKSCYENFNSAERYAEQAYEKAEETVKYLREMAMDSISAAEGKADPNILKEAKDEFNAGESSSLLGEKAVHYKKAWDLANAAIAAFVPANITSPEIEEQFNLLKAEVEGMLSRAQADGIDVTTERSLYEYYVSLGSTQEAIDGLRTIVDMILNKALIAYGDLEYLREEVYNAIESANGAFDYLLPELRALEAGYIKDGEIDFAAALGHLSVLKQGYLDILEEIENRKEEAYFGSIIWSYSKDFEPARLDEESHITMYIYATNPNAFAVAGGEKSFDFPFEIMQSEVSGELVGIVSDGKTLTLYPKEFEPFESRTFVVSTSQIIASTSSQDVYAYGYDGKADVRDSRLVEFIAPSQGLYLPDEWEKISIDGYEFDGGSGFINKRFDANLYEIEGGYIVIDAYDWEEKNHNSITIGTTTTMSYDIVINANMRIDEMKFVVEGEKVSAYATGGASVKIEGQEIIVHDVDEGETTLHVKYEIKNVNDYIDEKINELHNEIDEEECPEAEQALNEAILAYQNGDVDTAMEKLKEAEGIWEKYLRESEKAQAEYEKYLAYVNEQLEQIKKALSKADSLGLSGGFVDSLRERKTTIENFLAELDKLDTQEKLSRLKEFDRNWLEKEAGKFLKEAFSEVGEKKKEYYKLGVADPVLEGYFNEFEANYRKARASEGDYTPHVDVYATLLKIRSTLEQTATSKNSRLIEALAEFEKLKEEVGMLITRYTNEYNDGKKTPYENLFQFLPDYYSEKLSAIEKEVKKTDKPEEVLKRVERLRKLKEELEKKLNIFKKSAEEMLRVVEIEFAKAKPSLDDKTKNSVENGIETIKQSIANGRYVSAMNTANNILLALGKVQAGGVNFILWLGVLLLILAGIFYYIRSGRKVDIGKIGGGLFKEEKKEAKPLKKLERIK